MKEIPRPEKKPTSFPKLDSSGLTIQTRFFPPEGFKRTRTKEGDFAAYLRSLPLKPAGTLVSYYNGQTKPNDDVYVGVVDLPIGKRDLHQCADAIMRLRAEYLFHQKDYDRIHFNFTNGFRVDYSKWAAGHRISVKGNKVSWIKRANPSTTYSDFWKYMEIIFSYAGTLSLEKELVPVELEGMKIGDIFIQGGSPGHAVIVVDMAIKETTGEQIFLLAQSYMPAQEIQILVNPNAVQLSPWYRVKQAGDIRTPEWTFGQGDLKRFKAN